VEPPEVEYAYAEDGTAIAYQVFGDGPVDLAVMSGFGGTIEALWDLYGFTPWLAALSSSARIILVERRGHGLSGRATLYAPLEVRCRDALSVLDQVGSERAVLMGLSEGAPMSAVLAATHPERIVGLVLIGGFARLAADEGYDWGADPARTIEFTRASVKDWGTTRHPAAAMVSPRLANNSEWKRAWARMNRLALAPDAVAPMWELIVQIDVRPVLSAVRCPALVIHSTRDRIVPIQSGRYLAEHLANTTLLEIDSDDHLPWMNDPGVTSVAICDLLRSVNNRTPRAERVDRMLATIVFTDIVGSTASASQIGDDRWRRLLDEHDRIAATMVERHDGRLVKSTGDGILATFTGPGRAISATCALRDSMQVLGIDVRAGVHSGEIELRGDDIGGIAVHIAARVSALAGRGQILATSTVRDLVTGSGIQFAEHGGEHALKGVERPWRIWEVTAPAS
jgi:class 3 adenylate cyclase